MSIILHFHNPTDTRLYVYDTFLTAKECINIILHNSIKSPTLGLLYLGVNIKGVTLLTVPAEGCPAENEKFL